MAVRSTDIFAYVDATELSLCRTLNRASRQRIARGFFDLVSRLGDGIFWYVLMLLLPVVYGPEGVIPALHMGLTAVVNIVIYKSLKNYLVRERPFILYEDIRCDSPPLDQYSFPSGHTLHAVSFSVIAIGYLPELAGILLPFMVLVALSRVILGLHYPSDVLAGAVIGFAIGRSSMALFGY